MRPSGHQVTPRLQVQARQVTPHLRALFCAGVSCDSSPSRASRVGVSCDFSPSRASHVGVSSDSPSRAFCAGASEFACFPVEVYFMHREGALSPWMSERAETSTHGSRCWGAVIMWIRKKNVPYTRQPLIRGCYHVNYKMFSTHGSRWCGAIIMWMRGCPVHTAAADEGLLSCEWEVVPYTRQPLMRGYYHVIERLFRTHGSR